MSVWGALAGGLVGTVLLTTTLLAATHVRLTRMDLPFLLGTMVTPSYARARALGYAMHFGFGLLFALGYWLIFSAIGTASWWLGALLGVAHAFFAGTALVAVLLPAVHPRMGDELTAADSNPYLEPPGFLMTHYGRQTPIVMVAAHIAYGAVVGQFVALAG
ncbi:MAG TPA: hypothetical protein VG602_10015 [Actinomycetota bacterium]|nr:hypothetical protein [Actinomycetota bacterium]